MLDEDEKEAEAPQVMVLDDEKVASPPPARALPSPAPP
jgi:hypothetical protein